MNKITPQPDLKADPVQLAGSAFSPDAMIELRGVVKRFSNAAGEFTVLKGVNLTINRQIGQWEVHAVEHDHRH